MNAEEEIGHGKPPRAKRFQKGQSGNPRGRPPGQRKEPPYEAVLGQMVTIREDGVEKRVTAAEAFVLHLAKQGLAGDGAAARDAASAIEAARAKRSIAAGYELRNRTVIFVAPGSVTPALEPLRMARKLDRYRETARIALEPWIVEKALERLGGRRLTLNEQQKVLKATRRPKKVRWPDWWEALPKAD